MSCVSQSITRYSLIRCIVSSAQFARGELCFYESHAELLAQDAAGETTTPLRIDYDALLHFRVVRQEQLMRIEVPYRVVQRWADANGFAAELCSGGGAQPSPDSPCALIEQLSAEDMTHFLQCVAPVVAASRRARSASRVSTTEPLPLSYFPPSPQDNNNNNNNNTAETAEEPNEEYQEYKEEEKEEQEEEEQEEEEEEEQHEEESREGEKSEAGDEKSERLSRCLEHIAADHAVHLSRDCTTQVRSAHCSASSATSSSQCSAARQRPPRSRAAVRAKRQRPLLGTSSDGEPSPAKQSKAESQSASVAVPPMPLPMPIPLPMPMPMPSAKPRRVGAMVKAKPKVPCAPLGPTNALYNFADVMTAPENAAILRPCGAEVKKMLVDLQEILPCRRRTGAVARERQLQAKKSVKTPLPKAEVHSTDKPPVVKNSVVAENTRPANSVVAENIRPDNSVVAENIRPDNSVVAENIRPDNSVVAENIRPDNSVVAENTRPANSVVAENIRTDELMSAPVEEPTTPLLNTRAFHDSRRAALAAERRAARKAKRAPKSKAPAPVPATAAIVPLRAASECPAAALPGLREVTPPSSSQRYGCEHCGYAAMGHSVSDERKDRWRRVVRHLDGITAHLTRARACGEELRGLFLVMLEDSEI